MTLDDKHAPEPDPDVVAAAKAASIDDDDIDDSKYVSGLPGFLGVIDVGIARIEAILLAAGVLLMAINTMANVVGRVVGHTLYFSEEVNQALIILITFAGISYAARHGRHIRMSAFFDALPFPLRRAMMVLIAVITAAAMFLLTWYSLDYVLSQASRGRLMPALNIPQWWIIVWAPMGFFLTGLQYTLTAIKNVIDKDIWLSTSTLEGYDDSREEEI
ncbi:TRAP transporter small permease [Paracoccus saliphilus]|uniref:TRAP transporter small permease protein n=1 Tax=Paracoccus saliphilus TaxID=405559 RepID=A0AA45W303_9RHOB|nr:TRAP transporter small permease [Paracoccus saliphilus]WCR04978.1 TRAP transporter small permease [Paracoccus saliphilus]SIS71779.1 TRAP-type C4-dicarboxylate transport system, small permease component [Paracoccus saliphilus]